MPYAYIYVCVFNVSGMWFCATKSSINDMRFEPHWIRHVGHSIYFYFC